MTRSGAGLPGKECSYKKCMSISRSKSLNWRRKLDWCRHPIPHKFSQLALEKRERFSKGFSMVENFCKISKSNFRYIQLPRAATSTCLIAFGYQKWPQTTWIVSSCGAYETLLGGCLIKKWDHACCIRNFPSDIAHSLLHNGFWELRVQNFHGILFMF